ncbi:MAG: bifunctional phosphopantothenoylcysteine decarboxylase/phosphopantothenate--cysteine ligase CoaBC [Nitrospirae bacterium]|nr:bifunctional phosphopantothenoylcysteine decarboxylase/phosphopantothenate--cysteine ligase CoaBC [Nitrospirota bacterium]MBI3352560.1 bifunctional phosphopantothenoylcysteine decarboxylase/phosphopantothenate--cysteine ligase CoaBC [Nitrospirota bacterium]
MLKNKHIILGVTGSIAAYKALSLLRQLKSTGASVTVVMTESAQKFVTPLSFQILSGQKVHTDIFPPSFEMSHITLADQVDLIVVAPATANCLAKMASGLADDLLSALILASSAPVILVPAMDGEMWTKPVTRDNVTSLLKQGFQFIWPEKGLLASGKFGEGRFASEAVILNEIELFFNKKSDLASKKVCITSGPTLEPIDPVRFISNRSSGKMGFALAQEALNRGARVTLISGPTALETPTGIEAIFVETGEQMAEAVSKVFPTADIVIMAAAVADFKVDHPSTVKIKKSQEKMALKLVKTRDILAELGKSKAKQILVGFAAETESFDEAPLKKLKEKNLDLIVANNVTLKGAEFGSDTNIVVFFDREGKKDQFPLLSKKKVAENIFDKILTLAS